MTKPVPRSRLNITYRTRIEGRPVKQKLPFRLLVLGDLSGGHPDKLEDREVHSILPGMRVDNFMEELKIACPIEDTTLKTVLNGRLVGKVMGEIKKDIDKNTVKLKLEGTAEVSSSRAENGLGSFKGEVKLSAEVQAKRDKSKLTLGKQMIQVKGTVHGDVSGVVDTKFEFDFAQPIEADIDKFNKEVDVTSDKIPVALTIGLHNMKSFAPEYVAASVPELRRLMLIRRLLLESRAYIANRFEMREIMKTLLEEDGQATLKQLKEWGIKDYPLLQVAQQNKPDGNTNALGGGTTGGGSGTTGGDGGATGGGGGTTGGGAGS